MKNKWLVKTLMVSVVLFLSGCMEYLPFSSGALSGSVTSAPQDWTTLAQQEIIKLETNPDDPYSVNLWVIGMGSVLYVHAGDNRATWVEHIEVNPNVRMLFGENIYELRGERVTDQEEFNAFAVPYEEKYGNRPRNENISEIYLFRLVARES